MGTRTKWRRREWALVSRTPGLPETPRCDGSPRRGAGSPRRVRGATLLLGVFATATVVLACGLMGCAAQTGSAGLALTAATQPTARAATTSFLRARHARALAVRASLLAGQQAVDRYVANAGAQCPGVGTSAPRNAQFAELNHDVLLGLSVTDIQTHAGALARFASSSSDLSWGQNSVTALVRQLAGYEHGLAEVVPLDACAVFATWTRSAYRVLPAAAVRFQRQVAAFSSRATTRCQPAPPNGQSICSLRSERGSAQPRKASAPQLTLSLVWRLLKRYEGTRTLTHIARETEQLESLLAGRTRATLSKAASGITSDLGLEPLALRLFIASLGGR